VSATALGYRLACDACGKTLDRETDGSPGVDFSFVHKVRVYAITSLGWIVTGGRRADGSFAVLDPNVGRFSGRGSHVVYDVCAECAGAWMPPYIPGVVLSGADALLAGTMPDVTMAIVRLVDENTQLRRQLNEQIGRQS
jgi:hypothetical protein